MTASWCRGCATAPGSPPAPWTRCEPICPSTAAVVSVAARCTAAQARATAPLPPATDVARRLPVFRQPAEVSAVRLDLQREDRNRQPSLARTRQPASDAAGAADVRRRRRRRHRAVAGDARAACPLSDHAALRGGEGNQLRGRPADAREDGGPPVRTSRDGAGRHQPLLCRSAMADAALGDCRAKPDLEGRRVVRQYARTALPSRSGNSKGFSPRTGAPESARRPAIRSMRGPSS